MRSYLILFYFFFGISVFGQQYPLRQATIDTLGYNGTNCEYLENIRQTILDNDDVKGWSKYYSLKSYCYLLKRKNDSAFILINKSIRIYDSIDKGYPPADANIHKAYYLKGLREYFYRKPMKSLQTLNRALYYQERYPDYPGIKNWKDFIYSRIGIIHLELGDYSLALKAKLESKKDTNRMKQRYEGSTTYADLGLLHLYLKNIDSAKYYYKMANRLINDTTEKIYDHYPIESFHLNQVGYFNNLGDIALIEKKEDSALNYYKKGYDYLLKNNLEFYNSSRSLIRFYSRANYGYYLSQNDSIEDAISLLSSVKDSLDTFEKFDREERDLRIKVHLYLQQTYAKNGMLEKALDVEKELNKYLIDYNEESIAKQLQLFSTEYEVKKKDASIMALSKENEIKEITLRQQNIIIFGVVVLSILLIGVGYVYYWKRQLDNRLKVSNIEQKLLRSQLNPHFLFNALNSIVSLATVKSEKTVPYTLKLSSLLRSILQNSREEFVTLQEEIGAIEDYLELESNFSERFSYVIDVDSEIDTEEVLIPPMFIQPFIENSIKHGFKGAKDNQIGLNISMDEVKKSLYCCVKDNGLGYTKSLQIKEENVHKSLSGEILQERLVLYSKAFRTNAFYKVMDGLNGTGTQVDIFLPYMIDA